MALTDIKIVDSNRPTPIPPRKKCFFVYSTSLNVDHVCFCDYPAQAESWFRGWCNENGLGDCFCTVREVDWHLLSPYV